MNGCVFLYNIGRKEAGKTFRKYNANPAGKRVGDCTVRAISTALGEDWEQIYTALALEGFCLCDMPSANHVWGSYLKSRGYSRHLIPDGCPVCYSVRDFCREYPEGTYILALEGHVLCVIDGEYYDSWDSGDEIPIYYWKKGG